MNVSMDVVKLLRVETGLSGSKLSVFDGAKLQHESTSRMVQMVSVPVSQINEQNVEAMMQYRNMTGETLGQPYDMVVRATGWNHNTSIYAMNSTAPLMQSNGKFVSFMVHCWTLVSWAAHSVLFGCCRRG